MGPPHRPAGADRDQSPSIAVKSATGSRRKKPRTDRVCGPDLIRGRRMSYIGPTLGRGHPEGSVRKVQGAEVRSMPAVAIRGVALVLAVWVRCGVVRSVL